MNDLTNCNGGVMKFKNPISTIIVTTATSAARTRGGCHSKPNLSKTGLSANLRNAREDSLKAPLLTYGARRAKRLAFQSAENAMNLEEKLTSSRAARVSSLQTTR
jgi:hypothetical protein